MAKRLPTRERVLELLAYEPATGTFRWLKHARASRVGTVAGYNQSHGRWKIWIDGGMHFAHRLAWLVTYGEWPDGQVDHIDGDPLNNALANLRLADQTQNNGNARGHFDSQTGVKGVYRQVNSRRNPFYAQITHRGVTRNLGSFPTVEAAAIAYARAAAETFGEFARPDRAAA